MKRLGSIVLLLALASACGAQTDNTVHANQFPGLDVGTLVTKAQAACNPNVSIPCTIVVDAGLATLPAGIMPALLSNVTLLDYRQGAPYVLSNETSILVDRLAGATADVKLQACIAQLSSSGGICDASGFGATTQMIASTVTVASGVFIRMNPATEFRPSSASTDMFSMSQNSGIDGLYINALNVSNYAGNAVKWVNGCIVGNRCYLTNFVLINGANSTNPGTGTAVLLSAASGTSGDGFIHVEHGQIVGFRNGIVLTSTGSIGGTAYVNDNRFNDLVITNAVNCITLNANPGDVMGNVFVNSSCESGAGNIPNAVGLTLEGRPGSNAKDNFFNNFSIWDYAQSVSQASYIFDANTSNNLLFGNIQAGSHDALANSGTTNNIWNLNFGPLSFSELGIGDLEIVPKRGNTIYWLGAQGAGNKACIGSGGTPPGRSPFCVDPEGNISAPGNISNANGTVIPSTATGSTGSSKGEVSLVPGTEAFGLSTLSSGTVTVSNSAACRPSATCIYKFTNCGKNYSTGAGTLSVGTVTSGISFVIDSLSPSATVLTTDQSTVCWQIN